MTSRLWVGEEDDILFCENADAAAYFLEMPHKVRVMVPDFDTADEALDMLGVAKPSRSLLLAYAIRRWDGGTPD